MFVTAILVGIYLYTIFALGLLGILYKQIVILMTLFFLSTTIYFSWRPPRRSPSGHLRGDFRSVLISVIIIVSIISVLYRGAANIKYIPVVLGIQTKNDFLSKSLNFSFGDFYDTDGYFKTYIKATDKVLLYGFHNLYYVDFPFIDSSWVKKGDSFNYVAVQNTTLPKRFKDWDLVYQNLKTSVKIYSKGEIKWSY